MGGAADESGAHETQDVRNVDPARFQQLVSERAAELGDHAVQGLIGEDATDQGVPVRVHTARRQPDQHVVLPHALGSEHLAFLHHADAEARQVERVVGHHAGMLRRLASDQGAPRGSAPRRDPLDDRDHPLRNDVTERDVVQEEQRLRAGADDVVGAHRDQVDADRIEAAGSARDLELRPDAVGGGRQQAAATDVEEPGEPTDRLGDLAATRRRREVADQRDRLRGGFGIHARGAIRVAHEVQPVGSRSWSSRTYFPVPSGISIGYSPSKHARQYDAFGSPAAATMPSSERYPSESAPT